MTKTHCRTEGNERGQTLLMFVLFMVVLFAFIGLGVDLGFAYVTRSRLSKSVDAACLEGMNNLSSGQAQAALVASNTFFANYGTSGRDVAPPTVTVNFGTVNGNTVINVGATVSINTFFIRVLPAIGGAAWKTLTVGESAQATRADLIMSLVLDRSGSMGTDGGSTYMPPAVTNFVNDFDDTNDLVGMSSFAQWVRTDVSIEHNFKAPIKSAVTSLNYNGYTCAEQGLTNGLAQNQSIPITAGENVIKVIVFFTDGLANTFLYDFNCGPRNISPNRTLYATNSGAVATSGCTVPASVTSILGGTVSTTANGGCDLEHEAQNRAIAIADLARSESNIVYCVGLGDPTAAGECGDPPINPDFLLRVANDPSGANYDPHALSGLAILTYDPSQLDALFEKIASDILLRLSR